MKCDIKVFSNKAIVFLLLFEAFFASVIPYNVRQAMSVAIVLIILFFTVAGRGVISVNKEKAVWFVAFCVLLFSVLVSGSSITAAIFFAPVIMFFFIADNDIEWMRNLKKQLTFYGIFFTFFTYLPLVSPSLYENTVFKLLQNNWTFDVMSNLKQGVVSGFTNQSAINGWYLVMGIGIVFVELLLNQKTKRENLILYCVLFAEVIALLYTGKRGFIVFVAFAILAVIFVNAPRNKKFTSVFIFIAVAVVIGYIMYLTVPAASALADRFLDYGDDISNGRFRRYEVAWNLFKENWLFGIGWEQFRYAYSSISDVHNIYLQLLCETGIVGFCVFVLAFVMSIFTTVRKLHSYIKKEISGMTRELLTLSMYVQIVFLFYGFTGNGLYDYYIYYFYIMAVSIGSCVEYPLENDLVF